MKIGEFSHIVFDQSSLYTAIIFTLLRLVD